MHELGTESRTRPEAAQISEVLRSVTGLLLELSLSTLVGSFARLDNSSRGLEQGRSGGVSILAYKHDVSIGVDGDQDDRVFVIDDLSCGFSTVGERNGVDPDTDYPAVKDVLTGQEPLFSRFAGPHFSVRLWLGSLGRPNRRVKEL